MADIIGFQYTYACLIVATIICMVVIQFSKSSLVEDIAFGCVIALFSIGISFLIAGVL